MDGRLKKRLAIWIGCAVAVAVAVAVISTLPVPGDTVMRWFGLKYDSFSAMILYFLLAGVVGFPLQILVKAFPRALLMMGRISMKPAKLLLFVLNTAAIFLMMVLADRLIGAVSVGSVTVFIIALVMSLLSLDDLEGWDKRG